MNTVTQDPTPHDGLEVKYKGVFFDGRPVTWKNKYTAAEAGAAILELLKDPTVKVISVTPVTVYRYD